MAFVASASPTLNTADAENASKSTYHATVASGATLITTPDVLAPVNATDRGVTSSFTVQPTPVNCTVSNEESDEMS